MRVSTDEQSLRDTIGAQSSALTKAYAQHFADNATDPWIFVGEFRDNGVSGTLPFEQRGEGARLLHLIRSGSVDRVCVTRGDRLARDRTIANGVAEEFAGRDIGIEAVYDHIDLTTPAGRLHFAIMCDFAHYERELIRDRTMGGRDKHAAAGEFINGPVPFGYDVENSVLVPSKRLVPQLDCTESEMVALLYRKAAAGESGLAIIRWLRMMGVPSTKRYYSKRAERYRELTWPHWQHTRLLDLLDNPLYYGERVLKYNKPGSTKFRKAAAPITQNVCALVSRDLWQQAKDARKGHLSNYESKRPDEFTYLLTGKLICGSCGYRMVGNYRKATKKRGVQFFYICACGKGRSKALRLGHACPAPVYADGNKIEEMVLSHIDEMVAHPDVVLASLRAQQADGLGSASQQQDRRKALIARLASLERGKQSMLELVQKGDISADQFREQTQTGSTEAANVRQELELLENEERLTSMLARQISDAEHALVDMQTAWPEARAAGFPRAGLREALKPIVQRVVIKKDRTLEFTILFDCTTDTSYLNNYASIGALVLRLFGTIEVGRRHGAAVLPQEAKHGST